MEPPFPERGTLLSIPYHTDRKRQGYICEFCMTNRIPQTRKMLHGRKIHAPPPVRTIDDYCTDGFHRVGRGLAPAAGAGYDCALVRRSMDPDTARRHTQVPPYKHERTTDKGRRAGPMCPAAGTRYRYPVYRWVPPCRAGACPRRRAAPRPVRCFLIDRASGHHTSSLFTIPSYFDKRPPSATP